MSEFYCDGDLSSQPGYNVFPESRSLGQPRKIMLIYHAYVNCYILLIKEDNLACKENINFPPHHQTVETSDKTNGHVLKEREKKKSHFRSGRFVNERRLRRYQLL
jgi:hypothetical protein